MDPTLANARNFVAHVWRIGSWTGELPPPTSLPLGAARSMARLALAHPAMADRWQPDAALRLFGSTDDAELGKLRGQSLGFLLSSTLALKAARYEELVGPCFRRRRLAVPGQAVRASRAGGGRRMPRISTGPTGG